jgi:hypothetical protein
MAGGTIPERVGALETVQALQQQILTGANGHADRIRCLEDWQKLIADFASQTRIAMKIITFVGAAFGASAIALIWAIMTGAVSIH